MLLPNWDTQERYFAEEMDAMDSSSDNGSDDSDGFMDGGIEETTSSLNGLEKLETASHGKDLSEDENATLEWSQFMNSTEGMLQYMEEATATIQDVSGLVIPSPSQEQKPQDAISGDVDDQQQRNSSPGAHLSHSSDKTQFEPIALPAEVLPRLSCPTTTNLTVTKEPSKDAALADQLKPAAVEIFSPNDSIRSASSTADRPGSMECRALEAKQAGINESDVMVGLAGIPTPTSMAAESSRPASSSGSPPCRHAGFEPYPDKLISAEPSITVSAAGLLGSTSSNRSANGDAPVQYAPLSLVDEGERVTRESKSSTPALPLASRVLEVSHTSTSQQEVALLDQVKSEFACFEGGMPVIADVSSQADVMASVGETEVARRIGREKARCVEARQQRRKDSIAK